MGFTHQIVGASSAPWLLWANPILEIKDRDSVSPTPKPSAGPGKVHPTLRGRSLGYSTEVFAGCFLGFRLSRFSLSQGSQEQKSSVQISRGRPVRQHGDQAQHERILEMVRSGSGLIFPVGSSRTAVVLLEYGSSALTWSRVFESFSIQQLDTEKTPSIPSRRANRSLAGAGSVRRAMAITTQYRSRTPPSRKPLTIPKPIIKPTQSLEIP